MTLVRKDIPLEGKTNEAVLGELSAFIDEYKEMANQGVSLRVSLRVPLREDAPRTSSLFNARTLSLLLSVPGASKVWISGKYKFDFEDDTFRMNDRKIHLQSLEKLYIYQSLFYGFTSKDYPNGINILLRMRRRFGKDFMEGVLK